ncbi:tRNA nucleotidyltransferase/poly(A) polymerase family protein [Halodesulfovibrio marinisediminis]|uniref:Poly(A) polymerase n=1 Tax=Halodesulfovibrio marinisediminis DSM 17456 TaxID=1121457 RepID=A0A1N6H3L5_9BACT|nr:HD family phosphohydrolase [Halodesulfovibrio marinisediminis]SIO14353.1 poly(A) polymerase [Halodesulfovibrio marinisediminis DSM 17456]
MTQPFKDAVGICKTIMRNGFDAYVVNAQLQRELLEDAKETELDIACEAPFDEIQRMFPNVIEGSERGVVALLKEADVTYRFYPTDVEDASHPEESIARITPHLLKRMEEKYGSIPAQYACPYVPGSEMYEGFEDIATGVVKFTGIAHETLRRNYLLGIRALRFAANYDLPIEQNTWIAIVKGSSRILDYVPSHSIMEEWRKVEAENMWRFVELLFDSMILHGLIPEIAALSRCTQIKNEETGEEQTVFEHTIETMRHYPEELPFDWFGTFAVLCSNVGKLYTAEFSNDTWTFNQFCRVGAKVTRKIMGRLSFLPQDIDLVCHLVKHHQFFHSMLTDKGIRRFRALDEYPRLIEMARADLKARDNAFNAFNHNMKWLERADTPEQMVEPFLNGNEIMEATSLKPGPHVGILRDELLKAQIEGKVNSVEEAIAFVRDYKM